MIKQTRISDVFKIADVFIEHAQRAHPDDIALIAYYGSYAKATASATSDLDLFFVPDEGKAGSLSSQFILDGLPYDFWPVEWAFLEDIATARGSRPWAVAASLLGDAKPLYARSQADLARFEALQAQLGTLVEPAQQGHMQWLAQESLPEAWFELAQMRRAVARADLSGFRWASWQFVNSIANSLALFNQVSFSKGWGANWAEVVALPQQPPGFGPMLEAIVWSGPTAERLAQAEQLASAVADLFEASQRASAEAQPASRVLANDYFFVHEYVGKVLAACERGNRPAACYAAAQLQQEFSALLNQVEPGFYPGKIYLVGQYDDLYRAAGLPDLLALAEQGDLVLLAEGVQLWASAVGAWFVENGVPLNVLADAEELRQFLQTHDPEPA